MRYRMAQVVLLSLALLCAVAIFVPFQKVFFLSDQEATRCLATKILLLPLPVLFVFAASWAGGRARRWRH